jgi:hypothetical protein
VKVREPGTISIQHDTHALLSKPGRGGSTERPRNVVLARAAADAEDAGTVAVRLPGPRGRARRLLRREPDRVPSRLLVSFVDAAGNERVVSRDLSVSEKRRGQE